jgi:glycine cleavage system H protein
VTEANALLTDSPEKLNQDPHGAAWLVKVRASALGELASLMSAANYEAYVGEEK